MDLSPLDVSERGNCTLLGDIRLNLTTSKPSAKSTVVVRNEDKVDPVAFKWNWGEDESPIVDQHACLGVEIVKRMLSGRTRSNGSRKG